MIRLLTGDCRDVLATLPDASVHCCITSPPYYALRAYLDASHPDKHRELGSEATPDEYIATMVQVFREVRRVLRDDGTCWVNLGDSFAGGNNVGWRPGNPGKNGGNSNRDGVGYVPGLAAKQLLMMPARLALALQADGWWLRSDIIWAKPNPMPESCRDRPTNAHEHVFLLTKRSRYFYDADAVREEPSGNAHPGRSDGCRTAKQMANGDRRDGDSRSLAAEFASRNLRNVWSIATAPLSSAFSGGSYRIASRDCAVHDRQADLARVRECDARQGVYAFGRSPGKRSRPAELPEGAVVSIPVGRSEFPADVSSAIGRSSETHRTLALSELDVIFGDISGGHIGCMGFLDHSFAMYARMPANNTSQDASPDGPLRCQSAQSHGRIVGIATYTPRPEGCTCYYAGTVHKRQDHFASFPPELAERCIRAGTSEKGACPQCGAPWYRVTDKSYTSPRGNSVIGAAKGLDESNGWSGYPVLNAQTTTIGWHPTCACDKPGPVVPCIVLDPFSGAGTALLVADRLGRDAVGIDLSHAYVEMARARLEADCPLFADINDAPVPEPPEDERMADLFAWAAD